MEPENLFKAPAQSFTAVSYYSVFFLQSQPLIFPSLRLKQTHVLTHTQTYIDTLVHTHSSTQAHIYSCDNILLSSLTTASEGGDIWRWRAWVHARLNVTEEILCICECYKCKPYYMCVSLRGVSWYAGGRCSIFHENFNKDVGQSQWIFINDTARLCDFWKETKKKQIKLKNHCNSQFLWGSNVGLLAFLLNKLTIIQ